MRGIEEREGPISAGTRGAVRGFRWHKGTPGGSLLEREVRPVLLFLPAAAHPALQAVAKSGAAHRPMRRRERPAHKRLYEPADTRHRPPGAVAPGSILVR